MFRFAAFKFRFAALRPDLQAYAEGSEWQPYVPIRRLMFRLAGVLFRFASLCSDSQAYVPICILVIRFESIFVSSRRFSADVSTLSRSIALVIVYRKSKQNLWHRGGSLTSLSSAIAIASLIDASWWAGHTLL